MKKIFVTFIAFALLTACNSGGSKEEKKDEPAVSEAPDMSKDADYQKGLELVSKSDCFTCHKIDETLTGPAYREVANKYASMPDTIVNHLAHKIIEGGTGVWGQAMMNPHVGLSEADAEAMVKYIFKLKK